MALIVLMFRAAPRIWTPPFRAMGRLALTCYTLQSILAALLFYALAYLGAFGMADLMLVTLAFCAVTAIFSLLWLRLAPIGPAEWLLRAIAYGSFSMRRRPQAAEVIARSLPI